MARTDNLRNYCTDVIGAAKNKAGITREVKPSEVDTILLSIKKGTTLNGKEETYTAGASITKGQFVKLVNGKVQIAESSNDTILGVAKQSGTSEQTIKVIVPNI